MEYHGFWVKIVFKVYGRKFENGSISGVDGSEFVQGLGSEYIVRMIFKSFYLNFTKSNPS